jgi:hypothetical protein
MINKIIMIYKTDTDYTFRINCKEGNFQAKLKSWYTSGIIFETLAFGRIGIYDNQITEIRNDYNTKCITLDIENFEQR